MTLPELLAMAKERGEIPESALDQAARFLAARENEEALPWYLHAVIAVGAWLAAGFFIAFFFALLGRQLMSSDEPMMITGLLVIAAAAGVRRLTRAAFPAQVCLAFSVAGHALLLFGIWHKTNRSGPVVLAALGLAIVLYPLYRDALHRFLSSLTALVSAICWLDYRLSRTHPLVNPDFAPHDFTFEWLLYAALILNLAAIALIFLRVKTPLALAPLGDALLVSLVVLVAPFGVDWFQRYGIGANAWAITAILGVALLGLCFWAGNWRTEKHRVAEAACAAGIILLAGVTNSAILVAIGLLVLGYALQERPALFLGTVLLPVFLTLYYYDLDQTLDRKAVILAGSGVILLAVRFGLGRLWKGAPA